MAKDKAPGKIPSAEQQLAELISRFEPDEQKLITSTRKALQGKFPTANELVYDYTRSVIVTYSPNERGSDGVVALSADANGVRLFFTQGSTLPDPQKILQGKAGLVRYIELKSSKDLLRPEVEALMKAAVSRLNVPLAESGRGELIIKSPKSKAKSKTTQPKSSSKK